MPGAFLHLGDLSAGELLLIAFLLIGVPALILGVLVFAAYKGLSANEGTFTTINLEETRGTTDASHAGADRA